MPLSLRREYIMCSSYLRFQTPEPSALTPLLREIIRNPPYWPFANTVCRIFDHLNLPLQLVLSFTYDVGYTPWLFPAPSICLALGSLNKSTHPAAFLKASFLSHSVAHDGYTPIYTDGSKTGSGVGASAVFPDRSLSHTLSPHASIFTAELLAILIALSRILILDHDRPYVIYSDSRSALQALKTPYSKNALVSIVQRFLQLLHSRRKLITLCWIPAHVGVQGNESADKAARQASSSHRSSSGYLPMVLRRGHLPSTDYFPALRLGFRLGWQECWTNDLRGGKLKLIKPKIGEWSSSHRRSRHQEVVLARLHISHTNLTHSHLMSQSLTPTCSFCHRHTPQSVRHIFVDCIPLTDIRRRLFPTLCSVPPSDTLQHIFAESSHFNSDPIFAFLRELHILHDI